MKEVIDKLIINPKSLLKQIVISIENNNPVIFSYINQHTFNLLYEDAEYYQLLRYNFNLFSDGTGAWILNRAVLKKKCKLINATDLNFMIMNYLSKRRTNVFVIGGKFDKNFISKKFADKNIKLSGYIDGYKDYYDYDLITKEIQKDSIDVVIVAMGQPKQEIFANEIFNRNVGKVILCVGNFIEYYVGTKKRAPRFLINISFEWFYRLITEPKRLWKRYLIGIPIFLFRVMKLLIR